MLADVVGHARDGYVAMWSIEVRPKGAHAANDQEAVLVVGARHVVGLCVEEAGDEPGQRRWAGADHVDAARLGLRSHDGILDSGACTRGHHALLVGSDRTGFDLDIYSIIILVFCQ